MNDTNNEQHTSIENLLMEINTKQDQLLEENKRLKKKIGFILENLAALMKEQKSAVKDQKTATICSVKNHNTLMVINSTLEKSVKRQNLVIDHYIDPAKANPAVGIYKRDQELNLSPFKEFVKICEKHNIEYWLDGGALIGILRHDGKYIPWDYDVDVAMREEEFLRFTEIAKEELNPERFKVTPFDYFYKLEELGINSQLFLPKERKPFLDIFIFKEFKKENRHYLGLEGGRWIIPKQVIFPLKYEVFENIRAKVPNDIDNYLRNQVGAWERLPTYGIPEYTFLDTYINEEDSKGAHVTDWVSVNPNSKYSYWDFYENIEEK